ncbi:putative polygalacturonase ADPG1-like [Cocos nucifera]|uniref:Putative polygalacturonase ADPG1-like n=1 Tax=Cocos nucifera TaxID=13894 RepID=A0A8K0MY73_COCNU|nr:putative polygalacturonase ADPG1-like [Cocos nucifera]
MSPEIIFISVLLGLAFVVGEAQPIINVLDHGAVGDGKRDDTQGFLKAWDAACLDSRSPTLVIPPGKTFLLSQISFEGPCNSSIHVQVGGNIVAPNKLWTSELVNWISFRNVNNLTIDGSGQIDGQGSIWWDCKNKRTFGISGCNNSRINGLKFINSPGKHLAIHKCSWVHIKGLNIAAPADSPNTDGMYIQNSEHVEVSDTIIGTGDDCIAIGTGSSDVNMTGITCGPGHGISETVACSGIVLESIGIALDPAAKGDRPTSYCLNAQGSKVGEVTPDVSCLE